MAGATAGRWAAPRRQGPASQGPRRSKGRLRAALRPQGAESPTTEALNLPLDRDNL